MGTLAVVSIPLRSGLPKDVVSNSFTFAEDNANAGTGNLADFYMTALKELYAVATAVTAESTGQYLSGACSRVANACSIKLYDITDHLDGTPHGSPYAVDTFTLPAAKTASALPEEVAMAITLEAALRSQQRVEVPDGTDPNAKPDRPRQRYTGHLYFGPFVFHATSITTDANGMTRPETNLRDQLLQSVKKVADRVDTLTGNSASLGVWSRADKTIRGIDQVRTDNAFDTQRRRGTSPTIVTRVATADVLPLLELAG